MIHARNRCLGCLLIVLFAAGNTASPPAHAQTERTRALEYDPERGEFVEVPPPVPGTAAGDLYAVRLLLTEERYRAALAGVRRFVKRYGPSDALYPAALIARAEAHVGRRDYFKAHEVLQEFLNRFGGFELAPEAVRLEFVIAETYLSGTKRKVWGLRLFSGEDVALRILDDVASGYPESAFAPLAMKTKADYLYRIGDYAIAELDYARLVREYPRSRYHQIALRRTAEAALASFGGIAYDDAALIEAEERYHDYALRYPVAGKREGVDVILEGIGAQRAAKEYSIGRYYERTKHLGSAIFYYRSVVRDWPETIAATQARARLELLGAAEPVPSAAQLQPAPPGDNG